MIIKCLLKITKDLSNKISQLDIEMILLKFHEYLTEFTVDPTKNQDDIGIKAIKTIVLEIIKLNGD